MAVDVGAEVVAVVAILGNVSVVDVEVVLMVVSYHRDDRRRARRCVSGRAPP
jgi:hypothetical protein